MATTATFGTMLNEYLPDSLFQEELIKRSWLIQNIEHKTDNKGSNHVVPFLGAGSSSVSMGSLTDATDIAEATFVRGYENSWVETWGSIKFNHADLARHDGKIPESTFIKLVPDEIDRFMDYFKQVISVATMCGPHFAEVTDSTNAATGIFIVDHPERFQIGQKCSLDDDDSSPASVYVIAINMDTGAITVSDSRGGSAWNASAYTSAQNAVFYHPGQTSSANVFNSLKNSLLSNTNGGSASLHNQTKATYPHLQAINILGSAITASNILEKIFDAYVDVRKKCKGNADKIVLSFKHLGSILKALEIYKGGYKVVKEPKSSTTMYGWMEIDIMDLATGNTLKIVGIQEMEDDVIMILDLKSFYLASNGGIKKRKGPDGREWYEVRATTGYYYIIDVCLDQANLIFKAPGHNGIIHTISY
jgi:hypothetical protein